MAMNQSSPNRPIFDKNALSCVKEELKESEVTQIASIRVDNSPMARLLTSPRQMRSTRVPTSAEKKGFWLVKQPS